MSFIIGFLLGYIWTRISKFLNYKGNCGARVSLGMKCPPLLKLLFSRNPIRNCKRFQLGTAIGYYRTQYKEFEICTIGGNSKLSKVRILSRTFSHLLSSRRFCKTIDISDIDDPVILRITEMNETVRSLQYYTSQCVSELSNGTTAKFMILSRIDAMLMLNNGNYELYEIEDAKEIN